MKLTYFICFIKSSEKYPWKLNLKDVSSKVLDQDSYIYTNFTNIFIPSIQSSRASQGRRCDDDDQWGVWMKERLVECAGCEDYEG